MGVHATLSPTFSLSFSLTGQTERERERKRKRKRKRKRERDIYFFKGMTDALAPFSYLVY